MTPPLKRLRVEANYGENSATIEAPTIDSAMGSLTYWLESIDGDAPDVTVKIHLGAVSVLVSAVVDGQDSTLEPAPHTKEVMQ